MQQRIAILSDLHCHRRKLKHWDSLLHYDAPTKPTNNHPIASLLRLIKRENLTADALLVPGDITNKMNQKGFNAGWMFCRKVAEELKASLLAATVGNHDVDYLRTAGTKPFAMAKTIDSTYPVSSSAEQAQYWEDGFCILEHPPLRIVVINSVSHYNNPAEAKRGHVTEEQLETLRDRLTLLTPARFQIALMHHHPVQHEILGLGSDDLMKNGEPLTSLLLEFGFHFAVHGHKHHARIQYSAGGTDSLVVLASGSIAATTEKGLLTNTRNLFHIVELDDDEVLGCGLHGIIHSWEFHLHRGWKPASVGAADIPAVTGFGCHRDFDQLAGEISKWFDSEVGTDKPGFFEWQEVLTQFPQLKYLIPKDAQNLGKILRDRFRVELMPVPPDTPERLGRLKIKRP